MRQKENKLTNNRLLELLEWMYLLMTGIYLLCQCVYNSTYVLPCYTFPGRNCFFWILVISSVPVLLKTVLSAERTAGLLILAAISAVCFLAYRTGRELFLLMIPVLSAGAARMDYRKLLKVYTAAVGSFLAVTILCAFSGVITNFAHAGGDRFRSSWGIAYPTDLASLVLFLVMTLWLAWENMPESLASIGALVSLWISLSVAGSRTGALCSLILLGFVLLQAVSRRRRNREGRQKGPGRIFPGALSFSFLFFAAFYLAAILLYAGGTDLGKTLDVLFSYRLQLTLKIFQDQGLHAFGSNYAAVGLGGVMIQSEPYYFLDSSYPLLLIRYGWVLSLTLMALWTLMGLRAYRAEDQKFLYVMTVIAFHALSEHHFLEVQYNILLILPFAAFPGCDGDTANTESDRAGIKRHWAIIACAAAEILAAALAFPFALSRLHTVFDLWGTDSGCGELKAVVWCVLLLAAAVLFGVSLCLLAEKIQNRQTTGWKTPLLAALGLTILIGGVLTDSHVICTAESKDWILPEEIQACELLAAAAEGKVYADDKPELMCRRFPGFSRSLLYGQDLARLKDISVVVKLREDRIAFEIMGFQFMQISAEHAVYSNDLSVIEAMETAGRSWAAYDTAVRDVSLQELTAFNDFELNDRGGISLENGERLLHGPYLDFYAGTYEVCFDLKRETDSENITSEDSMSEPGETVCAVYVSSHDGKTVLAHKTVDASDFESDGTAATKLTFETEGIRFLQFPVFPAEGRSLEVTGIHYRRIQ